MSTAASLPRSESEARSEAPTDVWLEATARDPLVVAIMATAAFRRLHDIAFLGALDYTRRLFLPKQQRNRAAHSLQVAALANYVASQRGYPDELRRQLVIAALLHDIGHPPLSHSAEPALRARTGLGHHEAGALVIRGEVAIGQELAALLRREADVPFILDLLDQKIPVDTGGDLFSSPLNVDTLDGIARAVDCLMPELPPLCRLASTRAALLEQRHGGVALAILDEFWERKNLIYTQFIGQPLGILSDQISRQFFTRTPAGQAFGVEDLFAGETLWQRKYRGLFRALDRLRLQQLPEWLDDGPLEIEFRGYFIDSGEDPVDRYRLITGRQQVHAHDLLEKMGSDCPPKLGRDGDYTDFLHAYPHIAAAREHSAAVVRRIRDELQALLAGSPQREHFCVVATGSYGRDEACAESDMDYFILLDGCRAEDIAEERAQIEQVIGRHVERPVSDAGLFGGEATQEFAPLIEHIGGSQDSNASLTRRMLLLLEGRSLYGDERFALLRRRLMEAYIGRGSPDKSISRFLLNDVIRYYRTITTDVQHKACVEKRCWGLRSIKLKFSRKLLYFAAIIAIADTAREPARDARIARMLALLELPALQRIHCIAAGDPQEPPSEALVAKTREIFALYEYFLRQIAEPANRAELTALREECREESDLYMDLRESSKTFTRGLFDWLRVKYPEEHPIHSALLF